MRMEDNKPSANESYAGIDNDAVSAQVVNSAQPINSQPGDEINSILNAAHKIPNSSLTAEPTPTQPMRPATPAPSPNRGNGAASKAGSLINSFRGK